MLVEGVMGLFDGPPGGGGSTADLAALLGLPVVLVVDAARQGQSIAALVDGFAATAQDVDIAGVIANRLASDRHRAIIAAALAGVGPPLLGAVMSDAGSGAAVAPSRSGPGRRDRGDRRPSSTRGRSPSPIASTSTPCWRLPGRSSRAGAGRRPLPPLGQRIAVASDIAFAFAYRHILDGWSRRAPNSCHSRPWPTSRLPRTPMRCSCPAAIRSCTRRVSPETPVSCVDWRRRAARRPDLWRMRWLHGSGPGIDRQGRTPPRHGRPPAA